jgi:maltose O-acetyltransferase
MIKAVLARIYRLFQKAYEDERLRRYREEYDLPSSVMLGANTVLDGNISIGANTYVNSAIIQSGVTSKVAIGEWCAIGTNVNILAITHDTEISTGQIRPVIERDIIIGNHVWVGSNVFVREGCHIGNNTIIGANSVVITDVPDNAVVAGNPARIIKYKKVYYGEEK